MSGDSNKKTEDKSRNSVKKAYKKPTLKSESLMAFGASCNGTTNGSRKATAGAPDFCDSRKLMS
ncbi:MAG: hypothetical protein KDD50_02985 [Bdellovibrionales bacterium]|nr:hypothetical protein [Bdellovibrionales bacterium]